MSQILDLHELNNKQKQCGRKENLGTMHWFVLDDLCSTERSSWCQGKKIWKKQHLLLHSKVLFI